MKQSYDSKMQLKGLEKVFLSSFVRSPTLCRVFADRFFLAYALISRIFLKKGLCKDANFWLNLLILGG